MSDTLLTQEPMIRAGVFFGLLFAMALWEMAAPRRPQRYSRRQRWPHNLLLVVLEIFRDGRDLRLDQMLIQPFRNPSSVRPSQPRS